jgi:uncharacterized protein
MRFWDSSALVTLLLDQPRSTHARALLSEDAEVVVWWGSVVECASAIARLYREQLLTSSDERMARSLLAELSGSWYEIQAGTAVQEQAMRLLRVHPLRAADALQLAAALEWSGGVASGVFVSYDDRLRDAALREGFDAA